MMESKKNTQIKSGFSHLAQLLIWAGLLGLLALVAFGLIKSSSPIMRLDNRVPDFILHLYPGYEYEGADTVTLSSLAGKVVVINFWASWCKPCETEAVDLEKAWRHFQEEDKVIFLGVDYVDTEPEARSYLAKFDITYPNGPDLQTSISRIFNRSMGVPETYFIDARGQLKYYKIGPFTSVDEIITIVNGLLVGD